MRYIDLKSKHQQEVNDFPMKFAFSESQFTTAMEELGLTKEDKNKVVGISGGGFIRKTDAKAFAEMFERQSKELNEAIRSDESGEGFILDMFTYELCNHEYGITYEEDDALIALGLSPQSVADSPSLSNGLRLAKEKAIASVNF